MTRAAKATRGGASFDGVCIDGTANYIKLTRSGPKKWRVAEMMARSFSERDKKLLEKWLLKVYRHDKLAELPAPISSMRLLGFHDALTQTARATELKNAIGQAIVPLGSMQSSVKSYKLIKPSAFVFRTAAQRKRVLKEWGQLTERTGCGPEVLALRRTYKGSLTKFAKKLYELIRSGADSLETLNLDRAWRKQSMGVLQGDKIQKQRQQLQAKFLQSLVVAQGKEPLTGLVLDRRAVELMRS